MAQETDVQMRRIKKKKKPSRPEYHRPNKNIVSQIIRQSNKQEKKWHIIVSQVLMVYISLHFYVYINGGWSVSMRVEGIIV